MAKTKYQRAVEWIALNDSAGDDADAYTLTGYLSVQLVADVFGRDEGIVAEDVFTYRQRHAEAAK